jgi:hypothetical protein
MEQPREEIQLQEEGPAFLTITGRGNKECTAPTAGRIQQHSAAFCAHQTGTNEELCQGHGSAFRHFTEKFPGISAAKTKEGVFIGPQMCKLLRHKQFDQILICNERRTWIDFWLLAAYFLGSSKADNHKELVEIMLVSFPKLGFSMFIADFSLSSPGRLSRNLWGIE